jgi:anti-sigma regulatory factor (Ser/Thr protein kinase)
MLACAVCPSSLTLPNDHSGLADLADWLRRLAAHHDLPAQAAFRLDLVLSEAVTNVMDHAQRPDARGTIELACAVEDGLILVQVSDDGPPFDPTARAPAVLPGSLEEATPGGLGIHLMRQYTSSMAYRRDNDRNILCLTLPIAHRPASA